MAVCWCRLWRHVRFPQPLWPLVSESVLVESFEEGAMVSAYVKQATPYNARIADLGLRAYLQMILQVCGPGPLPARRQLQ